MATIWKDWNIPWLYRLRICIGYIGGPWLRYELKQQRQLQKRMCMHYFHLQNSGKACRPLAPTTHYTDVIMGTMASQITSLTVVYSTVYSGSDQRKHQSSASLVFVWGIHRWPVNSPLKWPVTRKMFPFDDVIMPIHHTADIIGRSDQVNMLPRRMVVTWSIITRHYIRLCHIKSETYFNFKLIQRRHIRRPHVNKRGSWGDNLNDSILISITSKSKCKMWIHIQANFSEFYDT